MARKDLIMIDDTLQLPLSPSCIFFEDLQNGLGQIKFRSAILCGQFFGFGFLGGFLCDLCGELA